MTNSPGNTDNSRPAADDAHVRTFLIADVRGYTAFTQRRGDEAAARLIAAFSSVMHEVVGQRGGRVVELRGDEAVAVFSSTRQAIRAAVGLQERFGEHTEGDPDLPLQVGMGLDSGEAVPVGDGFRGGALNVAARLCELARPGQILATEVVTHLARALDSITYVDQGRLRLKGLDQRMRVYQIGYGAVDVKPSLPSRERHTVGAPEPGDDLGRQIDSLVQERLTDVHASIHEHLQIQLPEEARRALHAPAPAAVPPPAAESEPTTGEDRRPVSLWLVVLIILLLILAVFWLTHFHV